MTPCSLRSAKNTPVSTCLLVAVFLGCLLAYNPRSCAQDVNKIARTPESKPGNTTIRVATFNAALSRKYQGELSQSLEQGDYQAAQIAAILRYVSPDIVLINEIDRDDRSAKLFLDKYLNNHELRVEAWKYYYAGPVNTGLDSNLDLDSNGKLHEPNDAWGFGNYPGQYGMAIFSRFEIKDEAIRTFQNFRWSKMPLALKPMLSPNGKCNKEPYYPGEIWNQLWLSSKSTWDIPIQIRSKVLHLLAAHPTPPVFDGPEDRNGCRNHDEIRFLMDYVSGDASGSYVVDDQGNPGPLEPNSYFVIVGDLNSDPMDADGAAQAIRRLLEHPRIAKYPIPRSQGGLEAAERSKGANVKHRGNPAHDTGDFHDNNPGNLRVDFVLPSANLKVLASGVHWPDKLQSPDLYRGVTASDHRLVWVDIEVEP